eukprot:6150070-Pyramimonas_sp.AAC.1
MQLLKSNLEQDWSLVRTWGRQCALCRVTPLTAEIVLALAAAAWDLGWEVAAAALAVGFDTFTRAGELLAVRRRLVLVKGARA